MQPFSGSACSNRLEEDECLITNLNSPNLQMCEQSYKADLYHKLFRAAKLMFSYDNFHHLTHESGDVFLSLTHQIPPHFHRTLYANHEWFFHYNLQLIQPL